MSAYFRSEYFHFSVKYKGHPLYLRLLFVEEGLVHIEEVAKQKWEEFLWQGELFRGDDGRWEWTEVDNFFAEYGGKGLADSIAAYVNENGVPRVEEAKVASVSDDL